MMPRARHLALRRSPLGGPALATAALLAGTLATTPLASPLASAAGPADSCLHATDLQGQIRPPSLDRLSPDRAWWLARGQGITVAVLGSGVDAEHPQLAGAVAEGRDVLGGGTADDDCDGSGTFVAGLIAARPDPSTSIIGIAPRARILPVRIHESTEGGDDLPDPDVMALGLDYAVAQGARVVVVYRSTDRDSDSLRSAVERAVRRDVVIVAGGLSSVELDADLPAYPCAYPEVVAVAGLDAEEAPVAGSCPAGDVDVSAPALSVVSTGAGGGGDLVHLTADDPGFATGYVAGSAALLLSRWRRLSAEEVRDRLRDTADRPASALSPELVGGGVVNPYAALTLLPRRSASAPAVTEPTLAAPRPQRRRSDATPVLVAGGLLGGGALVTVLAVVYRRASRRRWRPGDL